VPLTVSGGAYGDASFMDPAGDDNAAPDITTVSLAATDAALEIAVGVGNYQTLVGESWVNVWLELDGNEATGVVGFDALARYLAGGQLEFLVARGSDLVQQPGVALAASVEPGTLTIRIPRAAVGGATALRILAVGGRRQRLGAGTFVASDFAPDTGSYGWTSTAQPARFADAERDHEAAPDVTAVRASDTSDGWIRFAISTRNHASLPIQSIVVLYLDTDIRSATGEDGAELAIPYTSGEVNLQRWDLSSRRFTQDELPTRVRARNANGVLTIELHRSELGGETRFRFRLLTARFDLTAGTAAVDRAPDSGSFWPYAVSAKARLLLGKTSASPALPRAGRLVSVSVPVRRSDTDRALGSGVVRCTVRADATRVAATGSLDGGRARCTLRVPAGTRRVHGSIAVRASGMRAVTRFSYRVA
jgi:hypothetical protein